MGDVQQVVQDILDELVGSGAERGVQVAAFVDGKPVVDAVAGVADPATGRPVRPDTVFYNFSIGKGALATLVHQQVDAGAFGYDTPVAELWPEFARRGKQAITVRQVLDHTAGIPGIPADTTADTLADWPRMVAAIQNTEPWWEPGTQVGYHAYSFGFLAGEIVRRATGRPLPQVLRDDLAGPIGHPDEIWFGVPEADRDRLAVLVDGPSEVHLRHETGHWYWTVLVQPGRRGAQPDPGPDVFIGVARALGSGPSRRESAPAGGERRTTCRG